MTRSGGQAETWKAITSNLDAKGSIRVESPVINDFIRACRETREPCDAWVNQESRDSRKLRDRERVRRGLPPVARPL